MKELIFREAVALDYPKIREIHNFNVRGKQLNLDRGFLLADTSETEILTKVNQGTRYFIAVDSTEQVLGFLSLAKPIITADFLDLIRWENGGNPEQVLQENHFYIPVVATRWDVMGQGVARFLYESLESQFPATCFSCFIVTQPIYNQRSIQFHQKQGFYQIDRLKQDIFLDMKNYESVLMFKPAN